MLKRILSVLLMIMTLLSAVACTNGSSLSPGDPSSSESTTDEPFSDSSSGESSAEIPSESSSEAEPNPPSPPLSEADLIKDGTLWYFEDFERYTLSEDSAETASMLGWKYNLSSDANYASNTAKYGIAEKNGSKQFSIQNNHSSGTDSYITFLSSSQFAYLHQFNYTYQYDLTYADSSALSRYIVLISEFNGSDYYNSCHIRNGGYGNHEVYAKSWKSYADAATMKGEHSIATTLLGTAEAHNALKDISMSIRYTVNWETGHNVFVRINTEGYPGSGKWTLVAKYDSSCNGNEFLDPQKGGSAMAIKTGGKQNGYIDNILIWAGNGDEPTDKSSPLLTSQTPCHQMAEKEDKEICILCGKDENAIMGNWYLEDIPRYDGGTASDTVYLSGQALDPNQPLENEVKTQFITSTNEAQFMAYCQKLEKEGYAVEYTRDADQNLFRSYWKGTTRIYTYYTGASHEVHVTVENTGISASLSDFGYTYLPKAGESSAIYQYAVPMRDKTHSKNDGYLDRGMLYAIKLADNSLIIVDGYETNQFPQAQVDAFMDFLREITGVGETEKITVSAWYNTHGHGDHMQGFAIVLQKYHRSIDLQRVIFNLPSTHSDHETVQGTNSNVLKMIGYLNQYYPHAKYLKPHTGMQIRLADVTIDILQTHEDVVDALTAKTEIGSNYNDSSMVAKFTFGGNKTFLLTGDIDRNAASILMENWEDATLKVDVLQIAHHVLNDLSELYHIIQAPIVLVPQSLDRINEHSVAPKAYAAFRPYVQNGMCFFQNEGTVGLGVENGVVKKIYHRAVVDAVTKDETW